MTLAGIANRIKRIEKAQHPNGKSMLITYELYEKWLVKYDGKGFDTLEQAIDYLKQKYRPAKVLVEDFNYNISKMSMDDLKKIAYDPDHMDDKLFKRAMTPTKELKQAIEKHPKLDIEQVLLSDDEKEEFIK